MRDAATKAKTWIGVFIFITIAPLLILFLFPRPETREFWRELSVGFGFVGLSLLGVQFIPTARLPFLSQIFPMDKLYALHHHTSVAGFALIMAHPLLLFAGNPYTLSLLNPVSAPWRVRAGVIAVMLFVLLVVSSVWRKDLKMRYEFWRGFHDLFAVVAAALALYHIFVVNYHMAHPLQRAYWLAMAALWAAATLYIRVVRPAQMLRQPYRLAEVRPERGACWTLALTPDGHAGLRFKAGQFAWLMARTSPFSFRSNPFSLSSSAAAKGRIEFTIKELGDFTATVKELKPGEPIYVDGPYGAFDVDRYDAPGYVMIAGGIGSAPVLSILRTMADRGDQRPVTLFYGSPSWDNIIFREVLDELQKRMNLQLVHVLEKPPAGWQGESGYVTAAVMDRHLATDRAQRQYFICGPLPMIFAVKKSLAKLGIPQQRVHTENYEMA